MNIELRKVDFVNFLVVSCRFFIALALRCLLLTLLLIIQPLEAANAEMQHVAEENVLEVYVRDGCPHCAKAKKFLSEFGHERPWLRIIYRSVDHDSNARDDLLRYSQAAGIWPVGVPTFRFNNQLLAGFDSPEHTGASLAALVEQRVIDSERVETTLFGTLSVSNLGLPLFTLAMGLLDGFNPCAMWVLLFLLSLLVHIQNRKRMALIAGTFVLVSGAVYYAFMAAWLNVFLLIGISTALRWTLGGMALAIGGLNVKDFFFWKWGVSLSISDSAKPDIYARMRAVLTADKLLPSLIAVATLAVMVNFIELLCTAGFPAIYTAILVQQDLSPITYYAYLGLYIVGYVADDSLMVATAVIALSSRKLTEQAGRWLKLISGIVMLGLGGMMILRPEWLI
jgi:glutaredoxin